MSKKELKNHLKSHLGKGFCPLTATPKSIIHYGKMKFTYDGKEKAEFIEWTEKNSNHEICIYLQHHLNSKSIMPSGVKCVQVVVSLDHRDMAFQFGASISVHLKENRITDFEEGKSLQHVIFILRLMMMGC